MPRGKSTKMKPFQKLLTILISGKEVTIQEIDTLLGKEIYMYRLSTYMWHIKTNANGVVKSIKDGRKVTAYQLCNLQEVKQYMDRVGITKANYTPGSIEKKPSVSKLADLQAKPVKAKVAKPKKEKVSAPVVEEDLEVMEVTE
jgi:hypothetical protein